MKPLVLLKTSRLSTGTFKSLVHPVSVGMFCLPNFVSRDCEQADQSDTYKDDGAECCQADTAHVLSEGRDLLSTFSSQLLNCWPRIFLRFRYNFQVCKLCLPLQKRKFQCKIHQILQF